MCVCMRVCACVRACVHACVRACVRVCGLGGRGEDHYNSMRKVSYWVYPIRSLLYVFNVFIQ